MATWLLYLNNENYEKLMKIPEGKRGRVTLDYTIGLTLVCLSPGDRRAGTR